MTILRIIIIVGLLGPAALSAQRTTQIGLCGSVARTDSRTLETPLGATVFLGQRISDRAELRASYQYSGASVKRSVGYT